MLHNLHMYSYIVQLYTLNLSSFSTRKVDFAINDRNKCRCKIPVSELGAVSREKISAWRDSLHASEHESFPGWLDSSCCLRLLCRVVDGRQAAALVLAEVLPLSPSLVPRAVVHFVAQGVCKLRRVCAIQCMVATNIWSSSILLNSRAKKKHSKDVQFLFR